ncbi:MAG: hypothetical protein PHR06_09120 [Candidatus Cloacimonetes bacterium]|nr:hypothetical protein [Candidatus Cloacimonadota bacterium]
MDGFDYERNKIECILRAKEKTSIEIKGILRKSIAFEDKIAIKAVWGNGKELDFKQNFSFSFPTANGKLSGADKKKIFLQLGDIELNIDTMVSCNWIYFGSYLTNNRCELSMPQPGKPFSSEFERKPPYRHEIIEKEDEIYLITFHQSDDFPGCEISRHMRMRRDGMLEHWIQAESFPVNSDELMISYLFWFDMSNYILPYNGRFINFNQNLHNDSEPDQIDASKITENWAYSVNERGSMAIIWDKDNAPTLNSWSFINTSSLTKGVREKTPVLRLAVNTFKSVNHLRRYLYGQDVEYANLSDSFDLIINDGNPFTGDEINGEFIDFKNPQIEGSIRIESSSQGKIVEKDIAYDDEVRQIDFTCKSETKAELFKVSANYRYRELCKSSIVFIRSCEDVRLVELEDNGYNVLSADNGCFAIKSAAEFAPNVYSLVYKGNEWLASDFPNKGAKSWWNSWFGGLFNQPAQMKDQHLIDEKSTCTFIEAQDNFGNLWKGIQIRTMIDSFQKYKGMTMIQNYLMLAGIPVLCQFVEIENSGFTSPFPFEKGKISVCSDNQLTNMQLNYSDNHRKTSLILGIESLDNETNTEFYEIAIRNRAERLYLMNTGQSTTGWNYSDSAVMTICFNTNGLVKNKKRKIFPPNYIIISEDNLNEEMLRAFKNIRFE